ncbi:MAG TPA: hypothetical protein VI489_01485 [Candidatus Brocadiaceae bacterium]
MTKNPLYNALFASLYIVVIASIMFYGTKLAGPMGNTFLAPIAMISLFTLSAAVMGYLFGYQPFVLYFDGKKKQGLDLFLKTVAVFGGVTIIFLVLLFSRIFS